MTARPQKQGSWAAVSATLPGGETPRRFNGPRKTSRISKKNKARRFKAPWKLWV